MRGRALSVIASVALALSVAACGSDDGGGTSEGSSNGPIIVGAVAPLTGAASAPGIQQVNGLKAAVQYLNDNGGIMGRKVELLVEDSGGNPVQSVAKYNLLVSKDISVVFGDLLAGYLAMVPLFERTNVISMASSTTDSLWDKASANPNGFNTFIPTRAMAGLWVDYLVANFQVKKIGVIAGTDTFGTSLLEAAKTAASGKGIEVVTKQFDPNSTDVTNPMRALKDAGAEAVLSGTFASGQVLTVQALQSLKWDVPMLTTNTINSPAGVEAVKAAGLKNVIGGPVTKIMLTKGEGGAESDKAKVLFKYLGKVTGSNNFDGQWANALQWFDGMLIYKAAVEKAGSTDAKAVRGALESGAPMPGLSGDFQYSKDSHVTNNVPDIFGLFLGGLPCPRTCVAARGTTL